MESLIGVCALSGDGKNTLADILSKYGYKNASFALALKKVVSSMFSWDLNMLNGVYLENRREREVADPYWSKVFGREITPRYILQFLGTNVMRNHLHENIWVNILEKQLLDRKYGNKVIVTDVRFPNEIDMIHRLGGKVVWIQHGKAPMWQQQLLDGVCHEDIPGLPHVSEWAWLGKHDLILEHDSTIQHLEQKALALLGIAPLRHTVQTKKRSCIVYIRNTEYNVPDCAHKANKNMNLLSFLSNLRYEYAITGPITNIDGQNVEMSNCMTVKDLPGFLGPSMILVCRFENI